MVFLGAFLAEVAGLEAIIGAFLAGLTLNRFIPHSSALMNRIEFVGNAFFIPFFLISVGHAG
jgi:Kef-type K+ transport system membrane component KefB